MDGAKIKILEFLFDPVSFNFSIQFNTWFFLSIVVLILLFWFIIKKIKNGNDSIDTDAIPVKLKYKAGGAEVEYQIVRSYQNIEIAHKIYIELITRKAAIEIEEQQDVIVEVYNSWYSLFQTTRNELKSIEGKLLLESDTSRELIRLLTDILNKGLRPHLTEYQARFRKWYSEELSNGNTRSPQEIQRDFIDYHVLMDSIKEVNKLLIQYADNLKIIINGK